MHANLRIILLVIAMPIPAHAAGPADNELTAIAGWQAGGRFADSVAAADRDIDEAAAFGLILNRRRDAESQWELYLSRQRTAVDADSALAPPDGFDLDIDYYHVGGNVEFDAAGGRSYVAATLGATRLSPSDARFDSETRFSAALGTGLRYPLGDRAGLRFDLRAFATVVDNDTGFLCLSDEEGGLCAVAFDGSVMWQVVAGAGVTLRF